MSRHRPTGTFEFSHEDLGPRTWPVLGAEGDRGAAWRATDPIHPNHPTIRSTPPTPWTPTQLADYLKTSATTSMPHCEEAMDMLLRLADGARGQAGTKCESFCADALAGFVKMLHQDDHAASATHRALSQVASQ